MTSAFSYFDSNASHPQSSSPLSPTTIPWPFLPASLSSTFLLPLLLPLYLLLVHSLRHRRATSLAKRHPNPSNLSAQEAQTANLSLATLDFPFTYAKALQFALFRTYGIPSVSALLLHTTHLASPQTAGKRYADTVVLIQEFVSAPTWGSARWIDGMARMNVLHARHTGTGLPEGRRITNDDLLYTLSLFALEPLRWIERWEWRGVTPVEREAVAGVWRRVGEAMGIDYAALARNGQWASGGEWLADVEAWATAYEKAKMVYATSNATVAAQTVELLLWACPAFLKPLGRHAVVVMMDERLRVAMGFPPAPRWLHRLVPAILHLRKLVVRHGFLPRPEFLRVRDLTPEMSPDGCYFMEKYDNMPYYVKPTRWNRYGPGAWWGRLLGLPVPGDEGARFCPGGYKICEVGPGGERRGEFEKERERVGGLVEGSKAG